MKFSKKSVSVLLLEAIGTLEKEYDFDPSNGSSQVAGKSENNLIDYGKYVALKELHLELFGEDKEFYK